MPANKDYKKILIYLSNWLGDIIMSYPAIEKIRQKYPNSHISVLGKKSMVGIFNESKIINETIFLDDYKSVKQMNFDCVILFPNSFITAWRMFWCGIKERIGYSSDLRGMLLTKKMKRTFAVKCMHTTDSFIKILGLVGIDETHTPLYLPVEKTAKEEAKNYLMENNIFEKKIFAYGVGANNAFGKIWDESYFADIANKLHEKYKSETIFIGTPNDRPIMERISKMLNHKAYCPNLDLSAIAGILSYSSGFIGNDSGAMHLASAVGIPTVGLYFATYAGNNKPLGKKSSHIEKHENCSICGGRNCTYENKDYACKKIITPDEVMAEIEKLL